MKRVLPLLILITVLTPIYNADALSCRQVADLNEQKRIADLKNFSYGFDTRSGIAFGVKVYKANYQNQSCISSEKALEVKFVIKAIQSACNPRKTSDPTYIDWKRSERDYWGGLFGKNFNYACSLWKAIKI